MTPDEMKQRTKAFANRVLKVVDRMPTNLVSARILADQLDRSGTSVAANYRAACKGRSRAEFIAKLGVAEEEADESQLWIELIGDNNHISVRRLAPLLREAGEITAILAASRISARKNAKR